MTQTVSVLVCLQNLLLVLIRHNRYLDDDDRSCSTNPSIVKSKITISPSVTGSHQDSAYQTSSEKGFTNSGVLYTDFVASVGSFVNFESTFSNLSQKTLQRLVFVCQ